MFCGKEISAMVRVSQCLRGVIPKYLASRGAPACPSEKEEEEHKKKSIRQLLNRSRKASRRGPLGVTP